MLKSMEVRTAFTAWGIYLLGMTAYCMVYQAAVSAATPDLAGSLLLWLREWGIWLLTTPLISRMFSHYESLGRTTTTPLFWAVGMALVCVAFPVVLDTRSATSSIAIYLPRCMAMLVLVYLVWRAFLRNTSAVQNRRYPEALLVRDMGRIRDIRVGPDGDPYVLLNTLSGAIYRLRQER